MVNQRVVKKLMLVDPQVDTISFVDEVPEHLVPSADVDCRLVFQDQSYVFIDKAAGVHSVAQSYSDHNTVANWLLAVVPECSGVGHPLEAGLLNRLDFETSGLMVAARSPEAYSALQAEFSAGRVTKIYECVVSGKQPVPGLYHIAFSQRHKHSPRVKVHSRQDKHREAETRILEVRPHSPGAYHLTVQIVTGVRHQIRGHMAALGCPIVGDELYGGQANDKLMLRSIALGFDVAGKRYDVACDALAGLNPVAIK